MMPPLACKECRAIFLELQEALSAARAAGPADRQRLAEWLEKLDPEYATRLRDQSPLWRAWRRLQAHRALTGHRIPLAPVPPGMLENPN